MEDFVIMKNIGRKTKLDKVMENRIKDLMTNTRLTKAKIAQHLGITRQSLYNYLKKLCISSQNNRKNEKIKITLELVDDDFYIDSRGRKWIKATDES